MSLKKWTPILIPLISMGITVISIILFSFTGSGTLLTLFVITSAIIFGLVIYTLQKQQRAQENENKMDSPPILLVDDNKANRRITIEILKPLNIKIYEADTGEQAVALFKQHLFSLILMDIEMPKMDGLEVSKVIRELEKGQKRTPIIAISAHNSNDKKLKALTAGFDEYLTKPISSEALINTLERWFNLEFPKNKLKRQTNFSKITLGDLNYTNAENPDSIDKKTKPKTENATLEFIKEKSTNASGTIKKVVDVKQSLLFSRNNHELAKEMLSMLIQQIKADRERINNLYTDNKWQELGDVVHKINGGSCYCGVPEIQKQTNIIDKAIEEKEINLAKKHFPEFIKSLDELIEWSDEHDIDIIFDY